MDFFNVGINIPLPHTSEWDFAIIWVSGRTNQGFLRPGGDGFQDQAGSGRPRPGGHEMGASYEQ